MLTDSYRHRLHNLAEKIFHNKTSVTYDGKQALPLNTGEWSVECKINHEVYGTGSAPTLALAKEQAAEEAYHNFRVTYNIVE